MINHLNIKITGKVQGVWFRDSTKATADRLGVTGFVQNQPDGSVYAEAEGSPEKLESFLEWCRQGPPRAVVEQVETEETGQLQHFRDFVVSRP